MSGVRLDACCASLFGRGVYAGIYDSAGGGIFLRDGDSCRDFIFTSGDFWGTFVAVKDGFSTAFPQAFVMAVGGSDFTGLAGVAGSGICGKIIISEWKLDTRLTNGIIGILFMLQLLLCQGCNIIGFLANPGAKDVKYPAQYDLKAAAKDKKILVWVDSADSSGSTMELQNQITSAVSTRLKKYAGIKQDQMMNVPASASELAKQDMSSPSARGRSAGTDFVLYVNIRQVDIIQLHSNKYYSGQLLCQAALIQSQDAATLWPQDAANGEIEVFSELEIKGREKLLTRLSDAISHCIVRNFYACPKSEYRVNEERVVLNEMIEQETF